MDKAPPESLFKYQKVSAHALASLLNETIWLASPSSFNDPFDCAITLSKSKLKESVGHAISELSRRKGMPIEEIPDHEKLLGADAEAYELLRDGLRRIMSKIGVCCLSEKSDEILMWSPYADNHRGICVEYDCGSGTLLRRLAHPVQYSEAIPELSLANLPSGAQNSFLDVCLFTKAKQWEYEKEWRLVMHEGGRLFQAPSSVKSIIFGARMSTEDKVMLCQALRHKMDIRFREARLSEHEFAVEFHDFSL